MAETITDGEGLDIRGDALTPQQKALRRAESMAAIANKSVGGDHDVTTVLARLATRHDQVSGELGPIGKK